VNSSVARILVAGTTETLAGRALADRVAARVRADGHDAALLGATPLPEVREADAVVSLLDGPVPPPAAVAAAATAHALGKPALALHTHPLGDALATLFTQTHLVGGDEDFAPALSAFYAQVRPFAGRLVRDQVPRLVREAGHAVAFREAAPGDERVRFLKRKVAEEAQELLGSSAGDEQEEVADLLEALEALLAERGVAREDLKALKESKRRSRGGFERGYVVESVVATRDGDGMEQEEPPEEAPDLQAPDEPLSFARLRAQSQAAAPAPPPPPASRHAELWNLSLSGRRQAIAPKVEDPDRIEPALRDI
jgi:predicted house-cleaning noncanonical NTP pyrophosphatase (MazG superfamily)